MAKRCSINVCKREAETYCYHCSQDVCSNHFLEHKRWIQEQLPLLTDEVNLIYDRLHHSNKIQPTLPLCFTNAYNQLDKWREDYYKHIDITYQRIRSEIVDIAERYEHDESQRTVKKLESVEKMRLQLNQLLKEGDVTYRQLATLEQQLEEIKTKEQESTKDPDIRIITRKIDVDKCVSVVFDVESLTDERKKSKSRQSSPPITKPRVQRSPVLLPSTEEIDAKCPICFVIFPRDMDKNDRVSHVRGHCKF